MRTLFVVVTVLGLLGVPLTLFACFGLRWVSVEDVNQPANFTVSRRSLDFFPETTGMSVWITGEINGAAEVWVDGREPQQLSGRVDSRTWNLK